MPAADYQALVRRWVPEGDQHLTGPDIDSALARAVERYSQDSPRILVEDVSPAGTTTHLSLPAAWEADFSGITNIEYPVGQVPPVNLDTDRWGMYQSPGGLQIMLLDSVASPVRVSFTARHVLDADTDTIPAGHREPVSKYAAALLCDQLAAFFANDTDPTIQADRVQGQTRSQAFAARAKTYRGHYQAIVGVTEQTTAPAGTTVQLRITDSAGRPYLFHPRRINY